MASFRKSSLLYLLLLLSGVCWAQQEPSGYPNQFEGDWTIPDFTFKSGEKLAQLRLHYITLGSPERDAAGHVRNAVLVLHGTGGIGLNFLSAEFGAEVFAKGQPLWEIRV
jgi:homoserine O-acetyltransferase/O-succinyltransferase